MQRIEVDFSPEQYHNHEAQKRVVARSLGMDEGNISAIKTVRRSLDCRRRNVLYHAIVDVFFMGEENLIKDIERVEYEDVSGCREVVIVGAGPAGMFAALHCLTKGLRPIIVERGKDVSSRKRDIAMLTREHRVDADSNWCMGEGGAGTFSDGKLYTRSTKRGDVDYVLRQLVQHGAVADILLDAHAHIGTDRLPDIVKNIRQTIEACGGEYHFNSRVEEILVRNNKAYGVRDNNGNEYTGSAVILATGHSARDIFHLFHQHHWRLEAKPFALGVRVEHPQALINSIQYHSNNPSKYLPAATYSLTTQCKGHGVFSFCMCPGGIIVPAATDKEQQVVNGMSNSLRNSPFANSGIAVTISPEDIGDDSVFGLLDFQQSVEKCVFEAAGSTISAPTQRLTDFIRSRPSSSLINSSYMGQTVASPIHEVLPHFVTTALQGAFLDFDRKMKGFVTDQAQILAVESRTSSPVRIPRDKDTLQHVEIENLYPCGEGAGYAGGIVSSALDGVRCVESIFTYKKQR